MTKAEIDSIEYELKLLDEMFAKWYKEDDSLSGVLNVKLTKAKNVDLRLKMDAWKARQQHFSNFKQTRAKQIVEIRE